MLETIIPIPTIRFNGYEFRSELEAKWAVFFNKCGVRWEYETQVFKLNNGMFYSPDFLLHGVQGKYIGNLFVEVREVMEQEVRDKILSFANIAPILVLGDLPKGDSMQEIEDEESERRFNNDWFGPPYEFNFETIDNDYCTAYLGINKMGKFELFGGDTCNRNDIATEEAYCYARNYKFTY